MSWRGCGRAVCDERMYEGQLGKAGGGRRGAQGVVEWSRKVTSQPGAEEEACNECDGLERRGSDSSQEPCMGTLQRCSDGNEGSTAKRKCIGQHVGVGGQVVPGTTAARSSLVAAGKVAVYA